MQAKKKTESQDKDALTQDETLFSTIYFSATLLFLSHESPVSAVKVSPSILNLQKIFLNSLNFLEFLTVMKKKALRSINKLHFTVLNSRKTSKKGCGIKRRMEKIRLTLSVEVVVKAKEQKQPSGKRGGKIKK